MVSLLERADARGVAPEKRARFSPAGRWRGVVEERGAPGFASAAPTRSPGPVGLGSGSCGVCPAFSVSLGLRAASPAGVARKERQTRVCPCFQPANGNSPK